MSAAEVRLLPRVSYRGFRDLLAMGWEIVDITLRIGGLSVATVENGSVELTVVFR